MFCCGNERVSLLNPKFPIEGEGREAGRRMEDWGLTNALPTPRCPDYFSPGEKPFFKLSITPNFLRVQKFISEKIMLY